MCGPCSGSAGPLPAGRAIEIVSQVAAALDTAHGRGLVHRDVKPANMLLDPAPGGGRTEHVYLSDFGLSKQAVAGLGLTATGQLVGTLDYVAPEQIENRPVDGRGDLYSLACTAFEMLSGVPPFRRDQHLALLWAQLSEVPPPLTGRRPDLPLAVDQVMAKALAKSPGDRYARCLDFAEALRAACLPGPATSVSLTVSPAGGAPAGTGPPAAGPAGPVPADDLDTALIHGAAYDEGRAGPPTDPAVSGWAQPALAPSGPPTDPPFPAGPATEASFSPGPPTVPPSEAGPPSGRPARRLALVPWRRPALFRPSGRRRPAAVLPGPLSPAIPGSGGAPAWWPCWSPWSSWAWAAPRWP